MKLNFIQWIRNFKRTKKPKIPALAFWIGTKCTLKCKRCCNLIPYLPQESSDSSEILRDLRFILECSNVEDLQIQGGEPFTHPNIDKIIDSVGQMTKGITRVEIATNGTIHLQPHTIDALKRNSNIIVRVSNYSCAKSFREDFIKLLRKNSINLALYDFMYGDGSWFFTGDVNIEKEQSDEFVQKTYDKCDEKGCVTYYDGKIFVCGKVPVLRFYHNCCGREIPVRELRRENDEAGMNNCIRKFYEDYHLFTEECRFCRISENKYPTAEQLSNEELQKIINDMKNRSALLKNK